MCFGFENNEIENPYFSFELGICVIVILIDKALSGILESLFVFIFPPVA